MLTIQARIVRSGCICAQSLNHRSCASSQCIQTPHSPHVRNPSILAASATSLNRMITDYSNAGDLSSARKLFDQMPERDVVSWNSIIAAYARGEAYGEALLLFQEMHVNGWKPNHTSLSTVLSCCAELRALDQGKQVHGISVKTFSSANVFVGTSLITMYSKCKAVDCLVRVFDGIDRPSVASWNALLSGFVLNHRIGDACEVFEQMPERNVISWTAMIKGYVEVNKTRNALELFDLMPTKNVVSWTVMLGGFVCSGLYGEAIKFFTRMIRNGVRPTAASLTKAISACSGMKDPKQGRTIHGHVIKLGYQIDQIIEASLVLMYCESVDIEAARLEFEKMDGKFIGSLNCLICGYLNNNKIDEARKLFDGMTARDNITWNSMVMGYLKFERIGDAMELSSMMPELTIETATAFMSTFIEIGRLDKAHELFHMMPHADVTACTALIFGYMEEGLLDIAMELFKKMPERTLVSYNVVISGLLHHGRVKEAYKLFNESPELDATSWDALISGFVHNGLFNDAFTLYKKMTLSDMSPGESTIASLLKASATVSLLIQGEQIHAASVKLGLELFLVVRNSLINMYCRCGYMIIAESIFEQMVERDLVTWNAMIYGYAFNGLGEKALEMFKNMKNMMLKPDDVTFLGILSACSHMCLLEEAQSYFNSMRCDYGVMPKLSHYACVIDLLCRMGLVEKAERLIYSMPFKPDPVIWTSLLNGCRLSSAVELAKYTANQLLAWNLKDPMPYLHLVSIYGSAGRWGEIESMGDNLIKFGLNKQAGYSWI